MNYTNDNVRCFDGGESCAPQHLENLAEMMDKGLALANEILIKAYRINEHMFGFGEPVKESRQAAPKCFRDALSMQTETLKLTFDELVKISERLGVRQ